MFTKPFVFTLSVGAAMVATDAQSQTCQWSSPYDHAMYSNVVVQKHSRGQLANPVVVLDFWGSYAGSKDTSHTILVKDMANLLDDASFWSRYAQYGGTSSGSVYASAYLNNSAVNGAITDSQIHAFLDLADFPGGMPGGDVNGASYIDVIFLPPGVNSTWLSGGNTAKPDGQGFGYHTSYTSTYLKRTIYYAVINTFDPTTTGESGNTVTASHEIMEALTDPELGQGYMADHPDPAETALFGSRTPSTPEIGDLCNGIQTTFGPATHRVVAQQSWLQNQCRCDKSATYNERSFQALDTQHAYVLGTDGNLWYEHGPWGTVPPGRSHVDATVRTFQGLDASHAFVLGNDGKLWYEHADSGGWGSVPPPRTQVDGWVENFQALDAQDVLVLGTNGNLWLEGAPFGTVPNPGRSQIDGQVRAYQGMGTRTVFVLGNDNKLWLELAPFGSVPPSRLPVDTNVDRFEATSVLDAFVLRQDGTLWFEQGVFGPGAPAPVEIDTNVASFHVVDNTDVFVLHTDGNLWFEHAPFGLTSRPPSDHVDGAVLAYQVLDSQNAFVLGTDGKLWWEPAPFGVVPNPKRHQVDSSVMP